VAKAEQPVRILIIDDEEAIRESMQMFLEDLGYDVRTAADPVSCAIACKDHCQQAERCADVIFVDQTMPKMSGLEFLQRQAARGCKLAPQYKMLMTGDLTERLYHQAQELGCHVEQKPVRLDRVADFVLAAQKALYPD